MRKVFIASILVLTFCAATFAQTDKILPCPTIEVNSPPNIPIEGEPMTFTASLSKEAEKFNLKYIWTISRGEIIEGQGTLTLKVLHRELWESLTATLEIIGLPTECANTTSSSITHTYFPITPIKIDEFSIFVARIDKARLDYLKMELSNNPSANAYIIEHFEKKTSRGSIARKNKAITVYLKTQGIDNDRVVLLNALTGKNLTQFFIVPAGATPPTCEDCITVGLK